MALEAPAASGATDSICDISLSFIIQTISKSREPEGFIRYRDSGRILSLNGPRCVRAPPAACCKGKSEPTQVNKSSASQRGHVTEPLMSDACQRVSAILHQPDARRAAGSNCAAGLRLIRADVDGRPSRCRAG